MAAKNGTTSNRGKNGSSDLSGILWRHRASAVKGCILFLFVTNMFYFAARYVELSNTVRRLEAERSKGCQVDAKTSENTGARENDKPSEAKNEDEGPLLNYSQVGTVYQFIYFIFI